MEIEICFQRNLRNTIENSDNCHILTEVAQLNEKNWIYNGTFSPPSKYLYGPASLKDTRVIVYPCKYNKCQIRCPCFICRSHTTIESSTLFENHQTYHLAPHSTCSYCFDYLRDESDKTFFQNGDKLSSTFSYWMFHHKTVNYLSRGKAYRDYHWKKDFGDKEDITWDEWFSKRGKNPLKCKTCHLKFRNPASKRRHFQSIHYQKKFECPICKKLFSRSDNLKRHEKIHSMYPLNETESDYCDEFDEGSDNSIDKTSDNEKELTSDVSKETESDSKVGDAKEIVYDQDDSHRKEDIESEDSDTFDESDGSKDESSDDDFKDWKAWTCTSCCKEFPSRYNLQRHLNLQKIACIECSLTFCWKAQLIKHMKLRHKRKPFKCAQCDKEFPSKWHLKRHTSKANCKRPCSEVTKLNINQYYIGDRGNTSPSPGSSQEDSRCNSCAHNFSSKSKLKKHLTKSKESCDFCQKYFCTKASLLIHKISFHNMKEFQCQHCDKVFAKKYNLVRHMESHHKI